jgi:glycosyltransferase involved in cell wall biosynthesis
MADLGYISGVDYTVIPLPFRPGPSLPPADRTGPVILGVGRLEPVKGWHLLIEAVAKLTDVPDVELVLAGGDVPGAGGVGYRTTLERRADELGVRLRLLGFVPHDEVAEVYASARVVAMPSTVLENFSVTGIEALAAGRPLVTTPELGYVDEIVEAGAACAVRPEDVDAFAAALRRYLVDPQLAAETGARGRAWVLEHLDPAHIAEQRETAYRQAIERRSSRQLAPRQLRSVHG